MPVPRDFFERFPERIFQADARFVPGKDDRPLDDKRFHDNSTPDVLLQTRYNRNSKFKAHYGRRKIRIERDKNHTNLQPIDVLDCVSPTCGGEKPLNAGSYGPRSA